MPTKIHKEEFPVGTANIQDLAMQFKVMQALGYRSLFDPGFRREMRNPLRRYLYYKFVVNEDAENKKFIKDGFEFVSDKIGFFTDPELFKKFKDLEMRNRLETEGIPVKEVSQKESAFEKERSQHVLSKEYVSDVSKFLNKK